MERSVCFLTKPRTMVTGRSRVKEDEDWPCSMSSTLRPSQPLPPLRRAGSRAPARTEATGTATAEHNRARPHLKHKLEGRRTRYWAGIVTRPELASLDLVMCFLQVRLAELGEGRRRKGRR